MIIPRKSKEVQRSVNPLFAPHLIIDQVSGYFDKLITIAYFLANVKVELHLSNVLMLY